MIDYSYISSQSLLLDEVYIRILELHFIQEPKELINYIDTYKILPREELVERLNILLCERGTLIYSIKSREGIIDAPRICENLENRYPILIDYCNENHVAVIVDMFAEISEDEITMTLSAHGIDYNSIYFKYVVPNNYKELKGIDRDKYDYKFLMRCLTIECLSMGGMDIVISVVFKGITPIAHIGYTVGTVDIPSKKYKLTVREQQELVDDTVASFGGQSSTLLKTGGTVVVFPDIIGDGKTRARVAISTLLEGYSVSARLLTTKTISMKLNDLGFDKKVTASLEMVSNKLYGITFLAGKTGSGKNTTAIALLNEAVGRISRIHEYSSPVEVMLPIQQHDYKEDIELLERYLSLAKRQNPELVYVGELPSENVAFSVRDLANSGVAVISTLHIGRIWEVPCKLEEYYGRHYKNIISRLNAVFTQKLFPKRCKNCGDRIIMIDSLPLLLRNFFEENEIYSVPDNKGCSECVHGDLPGEFKAFCEHLYFTDKIKSDLKRLKTPEEMEEYIQKIIISAKESFEFKILEAVKEGTIHYRALFNIV